MNNMIVVQPIETVNELDEGTLYTLHCGVTPEQAAAEFHARQGRWPATVLTYMGWCYVPLREWSAEAL